MTVPGITVPLALSTAWNAPRAATAAALLAEAAALGFAGLELSSLEAPLVAEFEARAGAQTGMLSGAGEPRVVSMHAPCPIPYPGAARLDDLGALDDARRLAAIDHTRRTIDAAAVLGARVVVLHLGKVEGLLRQRAIVEMRSVGDAQWRPTLDGMLALRAGRVGAHLDRTRESLRVLVSHAAGAIRLAGETRYNYYDIPNLDEFEGLLDEFGAQGFGYWHDVGHAHTQATFGLGDQEAYLRRYRRWLLGFHLHDAVGTSDHLPPGDGEIDFAAVLRHVCAEHVCVLEVEASHDAAALARGARRITVPATPRTPAV